MSAPSRIVRLVAVAVAAVVALTVAPAPTIAAPTAGETTYQNKIFKRVNNIRANHDRVRLKRNKCLQGFANRQAERLAKERPTPEELQSYHLNLGRVQARCKVGYVGENIAFGPFTAKQMVNGWMNSPGHRANILKGKYRITGVAARKGGGYWWASQVFGRKG